MNDIIHEENTPEDQVFQSLRPQNLNEFIGQEHLKVILNLALDSVKITGDVLDHIILSGPPGLGKTTLANIVAKELGLQLHVTSAPVIEKPSDLADLLIMLEPRDMLFIDEIHGLPKNVEEVLYSAMEDFQLDVSIGKGRRSSAFRLDLVPFTLIGATTLSGKISAPLRNRFGLQFDMEFYSIDELVSIIKRSARIMGLTIEDDASQSLAKRCRGTARLANRLLKRIKDLAIVNHTKVITLEHVDRIMSMLRIDSMGLDETDRKLLRVLGEVYNNGPVGVKALAASMSIAPETISEVHEPYLLVQGLCARTSKGRVLTEKGRKYLEEFTNTQ